VAFQDSDDEWLEDKLAEQVNVLEGCTRAAMVYGDLLRIPQEGSPFVIQAPDLRRGELFDDRPYCYASACIGIQTCLIRRDVLTRLGGFDERMRRFEDLELFLRITREHYTVRLPRIVCRYYETEGVSKDYVGNIEARLFLVRRYALPLLLRRPRWLLREGMALMRAHLKKDPAGFTGIPFE
jgi:hypothetical protein